MRGCSFVCCKSDWLNATTDPINLSRPNRCITHATSPRKSETHRMSYMPARTKCLGSHLGLTHSYTLQDSHSLTRMTCTRNLMPKRTSSCKSADASTFSFSTSWATIRPSVAPHDLSKQKNNRALPLRRTSFFFVSFIGSSGFIRTIPPVTFKSLSEISPARFRDKSTKLRMSSEREKRSMKLLFGEKEDMEI